jgi:3-methyladenine DNA glycosylase AlkD
MLALLVLVRAFEKGDDASRKAIYDLYLASTGRVNNWDLVDASAPAIVGGFLAERGRGPLTRLARSDSLWERRIAVVSALFFIRRGDLQDTLRLAGLLLGDGEDLIHKAAGWMLREVGKRDVAALEGFLAGHCRRMPRTMLRYAIERLPEARRQQYLKGEVPPAAAAPA